MKIGYCTHTDPNDKKAWSGSHYYILKSLQKHCGEIVKCGPLHNPYEKWIHRLNKLTMLLFNKKIELRHNWLVVKKFARLLEKKIKTEQLDILFFPAGGVLIADLKTEIPIISFYDATMKININYYKDYKNLFKWSEQDCLKIDQTAFSKSKKIVFSSKWAADSAINDYKIAKEKVKTVLFGANLSTKLTRNEILSKRQLPKICKLLFIGVEWIHKGGEIAYETMLELNKRGILTELTICGCIPPEEFQHEKMKVIGYLDKHNEKDQETLSKLYQEATFFILPTRNECAGIVFCEASMFALPKLGTQTGGVGSYIENDQDGYLLPLNARGNEYADKIEPVLKSEEQYFQLCKTSRNKYEKHYNWDVFGQSLNNILKEI